MPTLAPRSWWKTSPRRWFAADSGSLRRRQAASGNRTEAPRDTGSAGYITALEVSLGVPFTHGNAITVLKNGVEIFPAMLAAISAATRSIRFLTYVYWQGDVAQQFAERLAARAREGLDVCVILDGFGAAPIERWLVRLMEDAGVRLVWFRPISSWQLSKKDNRTHRKLLICDDSVAFTGGVGIAAEWEGDARNSDEWRDTHFKIEGPAVPLMRAAFAENWFEETDELLAIPQRLPPANGDVPLQVIRSSPTLGPSNVALLFGYLLTLARHSVYINTGYFVPDEFICTQLCACAGRGVDVRVLMPDRYIDSRVSQVAGRECYGRLLRAGVQLLGYQKTMLHQKILIVDRQVCLFGSANFNQRSLGKDDEVAVAAVDADLASILTQHFVTDCESSTPITEDSWRKRGLAARALEKLASLVRHEA